MVRASVHAAVHCGFADSARHDATNAGHASTSGSSAHPWTLDHGTGTSTGFATGAGAGAGAGEGVGAGVSTGAGAGAGAGGSGVVTQAASVAATSASPAVAMRSDARASIECSARDAACVVRLRRGGCDMWVFVLEAMGALSLLLF